MHTPSPPPILLLQRPLVLLVQDWLKAALDEPRDVDLTDAAAMVLRVSAAFY